MIRQLAFAIVIAFTFPSPPALGATSDLGVMAMLARSADAWNRGDLDTFMRNYENAPTTVYISAKGVLHGYAAIRAHYAAHYGHDMGTLGVSNVTVRPLDANYAIVLARWHVTLRSGKALSGPFSLVLHRAGDSWRIVEDCTP